MSTELVLLAFAFKILVLLAQTLIYSLFIFFVNLVDKKPITFYFLVIWLLGWKFVFISLLAIYIFENEYLCTLLTYPFKESFYFTQVFHVHCHMEQPPKLQDTLNEKKARSRPICTVCSRLYREWTGAFMLYMNRARVKDIQTRVKDMHNTDCSGKKARQKTFIPYIPLQNRQFK